MSTKKNTNISVDKTFKSHNYHGFTLVELIVVITILAILGTIAFVSLSGHSGSARDSARVSDLTNLSQGLDITYAKSGTYPLPDDSFAVTYSGGILWYQGTIGEGVINIMGSAGGVKMNKKPTDPLFTTKEYTYSRLAYGNKYQIKSDWEGDTLVYSNTPDSFWVERANAASGNPTLSYIKGNYSGLVTRTETGGIIYLLTAPSIVTNTGTTGQTMDLISNLSNTFLLNGQSNSGGIAYTSQLAYSSGSLPSTVMERQFLAIGIAKAYSGTALATQSNIQPYITALANNDDIALRDLGGGAATSLGGTPPPAISWTVSDGGDCTIVNNTFGSDGDTSTCVDNRIYNHIGTGATHAKTYNLLKIAGKWWFNQNLAYPLRTGYKGNSAWANGVDRGYYSCPGAISTSTTVDCNSVSTLGYLYQWSAAMSGSVSNNNQTTRTRGICPIGWGLPTKADFTSVNDSYWPTDDSSLAGNTTGWVSMHTGYRLSSPFGVFVYIGASGYLWSSFDNSSSTSNAWSEAFTASNTTQSSHSSILKANGLSVRCLKN